MLLFLLILLFLFITYSIYNRIHFYSMFCIYFIINYNKINWSIFYFLIYLHCPPIYQLLPTIKNGYPLIGFSQNTLQMRCVSLRVDTEEWIATVEVLLSKSSEACQWMVQYLVSPEGREIIKWVRKMSRSIFNMPEFVNMNMLYSTNKLSNESLWVSCMESHKSAYSYLTFVLASAQPTNTKSCACPCVGVCVRS